MKPKWLINVLFLSLAINAGVLAALGYYYYPHVYVKPSEPCPMSPGDSHLYQTLGLSDLQLLKIEPLVQEFHGRLAKLGAIMEKKKGILINLLEKDREPVGIENLKKEMSSMQEEIQSEVITHIIETKKILDSKQQKRFFYLMRQSVAQKNSF